MDSLEPLNILLIDDEYMILEMASEILKFLGHQVFIATSGADGLKIFFEQKDQLDLIIIDLLMPGMNGKEVYQQIRQINATIPIILSTGISDAKDKESLKNLDVFAFLEKPYTLPQLENLITKIVNQVKK